VNFSRSKFLSIPLQFKSEGVRWLPQDYSATLASAE
jgi:hypothetical protein